MWQIICMKFSIFQSKYLHYNVLYIHEHIYIGVFPHKLFDYYLGCGIFCWDELKIYFNMRTKLEGSNANLLGLKPVLQVLGVIEK